MSPSAVVPPHPKRRAKRVVTAGLALGLAAGFGPALVGSAQAAPTAITAADAPSVLPSGRTTYRTINDYNAEMLDLAAANPGLVKHFALPHQTRMGKDVYGIEVTDDVAAKDGKPVMFMMGMHHGNEWPSGEHTIEFAYDLINHFNAGDPEITDLLHKVRVIFVPVVNVDGFMRNRRTACGVSPDCASAAGVDVNRNYPFGWGANIASNFTTRGPGPGTEPEIQNVMDVVKSHQVTTLITNHTSGHTVLRAPFQVAAGDAPDEPAYKALTDAITAKNGYTGMQSGYDYETTGETNDWSYYATRGFGFTFEIMKTQSTNGTYPQVIDDYNGTGIFEGHSNREAFLVVLRHTAEASGHSRITGEAAPGTVLKVSKDFDLWTSPIKNIDGTTSAPQPVSTHLESTMTVPANGHFTWNVNPSVRPQPGYTSTGVVATAPGKFLQESWTLTCSSPDGTVLDRVPVTVDLGQVADVDLPNCAKVKSAAKIDAKLLTKDVRVGQTSPQIAVHVTAKGVQPTGRVVALVDGTEVGTTTLTDGQAVLTLPPFADAGPVKVVVTYAGDDHFAGISKMVPVNVKR